MKNIIISKELRAGPNNNALVIGAAGSGKSYSYVLPNILNATGSYVINDPGGYLYETTGKHLKAKGYAVYVINLININESERYNPFSHIKDDDGIITLVQIILEHTESPYHIVSGSDSLKKAEQYLLGACIGHLLNECLPEDGTFENVLKLLNCGKNEQEHEKSILDILFSDYPESMSTHWYNEYKKERKGMEEAVCASCINRLKIFYNGSVKRFTETSDFDFASIDCEKTAVFCITPRFDTPHNIFAHLLYRQIYDDIVYKRLHKNTPDAGDKKESIPVHFILDEFERFGRFNNLNGILREASEHDISFSLVIQAFEQLKAVYEDWLQIVNRCEIKVITGHTTELTTSVLDIPTGFFRFLQRDECILLVEGKTPEIIKKNNPEKHPAYKLFFNNN